jgi:predicted DNA-binding mobile mystery protein A
MNKQSLELQQLDKKMKSFRNLKGSGVPSFGWIHAVRSALGMSLEQLGKKMQISKQSVQSMERREKEGLVTLKVLSDAAKALDMQLVYGFVPIDGSLDTLIERKARELATRIVLRTSATMKLEDQKNSDKRLEKAIQERTVSIRNEMPKTLWQDSNQE